MRDENDRLSVLEQALETHLKLRAQPGTDAWTTIMTDDIQVVSNNTPRLDRYFLPESLLVGVWRHALGAPTTDAPRTSRWTVFAAGLAGQARSHLRDDWSAILAEPGLTMRQRRRLIAGFVVAAARMRARDLVRPLWRPVDWTLAVPGRTNAIITALVGTLVIYFARIGGVHGVLTEGLEPCAIVGGGLYALSRWLRRVRGVELASRDEPPPS